jgi:hypothetical protein
MDEYAMSDSEVKEEMNEMMHQGMFAVSLVDADDDCKTV